MNKIRNLYGLVLAGGQSTRMGRDKGMMSYHNMPQVSYMARLMEPFCEKVFVSCSASQTGKLPAELALLPDAQEYNGTGPVAALLTAFTRFPEVSFLLLGCDYPLFSAGDIQKLIDARKNDVQAIAFYNPETNIPEALLGIYEQSCREALFAEAAKGNHSLRYFLQTIPSALISPDHNRSILSVDTPEASEEIFNTLKTQ